MPGTALSAVLTGTVTDAQTGKPIAGATVSLGNPANAARTNAAGVYRLAIPSGRPTAVSVSARGYTASLSMGKVRAHSVTRADFKLNRRVPGKPNVPPFPGTFGKP
jgi:protocatechuate 3,4-dioxygenase beta subunit